MAVTLADVAARAGVSPATVSRVLKGNYPVAEPTRRRVLRAVEELDYVLNGPASSLAAATSDLVGILVTDIADPFFGIIAGAAQSAIGTSPGTGGTRTEKLAVVCNTGGSSERELTYLTLLQRQRAAAVLLVGGALEDPEHQRAMDAKLGQLADAGTRIVLCGRGAPTRDDASSTSLTFDNERGARELTAHLLALGHRRIGCVAGPEERTTARHRLAGHHGAMAAAGLAQDVGRMTVSGPYDRPAGYLGARELLSRESELTAIVAANDTVALGAAAAVRDRGLRIPRDVSVTGFCDLPFAADTVPALTTVRLPLAEAGARAGRLAVGDESASPSGLLELPAELVVRDSTAPPTGG